eukprot:TRINITY_DN12429_c0_g1_i1.p1 TRINITY_DN12429_c0_g1~~TRINITY_DN12429_c0_g1_i1.p1  ORF type:complete len:1277 (+),score=586.43 TRINITY_DN12429_c0_g1_i1:65-3895(+)
MNKKWDYVNFREDMKDPDPDKPHQALFDLNQELEKGIVLDEGVQKHVFQDVLKQALESSHSDVQGAAVKCIPALVKKVKETFVTEGILKLSEKLTDTKKEHRDIATISLKYIVENVPPTYKECMHTLAFSLVKLMKSPSDDIKLDIMDVVVDLLRKFGGILSSEHEQLQQVLVSALSSSNQSVRKRAINCIAVLSVHTNESLFQQIVTGQVITGIEKDKGESLRKCIQLCSTISRTAGHRVGVFLGQIMPLLLSNLEEDMLAQIEDDGERNEVRENILQAFESLIIRCPQQVSPFLEKIIAACKDGMSYDPYYDYDDDEDEPMDEVEDEEDDYQDMLEAEADDDDDVSWKVRKASAKCLSALIQSRPDCLDYVYAAICSKQAREVDLKAESPSDRKCLPERFKEREESVRLDIFKVFTDLLAATQISTAERSQARSSGMSGSYSASFHMKVESRPEVRHLLEVKDFIVDSIIKATKDKSMKVKATCITLLKSLLVVLKGELDTSIGKFLKVIKDILHAKDTTSALKTEVLQFLLLIVVSCPSESPEAQQIVPELLPLILACVTDKYYRITSEALRVCGELAPVVVKAPDAEKRAVQLFDAVFERLSTPDVDQEVKDCTITTMGHILKYAGSQTPQQLLSSEMISKSFKQYLVLLGSDYSRVPVLKALTMTKGVKMETDVLNKFVTEISTFLRKASRPLRQASLHCLKTLVERKNDVQKDLLKQILMELTPLLNDIDLHLSHLAIDLCDAVLKSCNDMALVVEEHVLPKFIGLLKSPLLQGSALESLENVFVTMWPLCSMGYHPLLQHILSAADGTGDNRQVLSSIAAVTARITSMASEDQQAKTIEQYISYIADVKNSKQCSLGIACLGEIGKYVNISSNARALDSIKVQFGHAEEDVKTLAAVSLGKITVGSPDNLLPQLLNAIDKEEANRYLLFRALKETLARSSASNDFDPVKNSYGTILKACLGYAGTADEGIRNIVSECLGKLAMLEPEAVTKGMYDKAVETGPVSDTTATIITAMKYAVSEVGFRYERLEADLEYFLGYMTKPEGADKDANLANVKVRRAAVQLLTSAVHSKPDAVRGNLQVYMKKLLDQCVVDNELVRSVNLGPFMHKVDDGLELRKSAYECIDILLDGCFSGESLLDYLNDYMTVARHLVLGMQTNQGSDIQVLSFIMYSKLCKIPRAQMAVISLLGDMFGENSLPKIVSSNLSKFTKANTVQQEKDKISDLIVSMLKMYSAVVKVPGTEENTILEIFTSQVVPTIPEEIREKMTGKE